MPERRARPGLGIPAAATGCASSRRTRSARRRFCRRSRRAAHRLRLGARQHHLDVRVAHRLPGGVRRLRPDGDRRGLPRRERDRDALCRRGCGRCLPRHAPRLRLRGEGRLRDRLVHRHGAGRNARLLRRRSRRLVDRPARRPSAARAARPLAARDARAARPRRALVRALGERRGARRPPHAARTVLRLDSRRRLRDAACPVRALHARRLGGLGLRDRRCGLRARLELQELRSRLQICGVRRRGRRSGAGGVSHLSVEEGRYSEAPVTIPLVDVHSQYEPLIPELEARFREVLDGGQFIRGPHFYAFQEEAAAYLDAMEIGPGDEVICPAFTFYATAESIARRGATPVFADVDPVTLNMDPEDAAAKITSRTRAIMPVHLFGRPADLDALSQLGLPLIEDAAQAFGAPGVAQHGVFSTYSFFPTKNLFCLGDGGLVVSNDEALAERLRVLAFHGSRDKVDFDFVGYNSRLDELQASFLRLFLIHLDEWNRGRREAAARYAELGLGELVELPLDEDGHIYHLFVCRSPERDRIRAALV